MPWMTNQQVKDMPGGPMQGNGSIAQFHGLKQGSNGRRQVASEGEWLKGKTHGTNKLLST